MVNTVSVGYESLWTNSAGIWFLSCVSSYMVHPTRLVFEDLPAILVRTLVHFPATSIAYLLALKLVMKWIWWDTNGDMSRHILILLYVVRYQVHLSMQVISCTLILLFTIFLVIRVSIASVWYQHLWRIIVQKLPIF